MGERFFEDLEVGQTFTSGEVEVTAERIKSFAAEFDPQPFHLDEEAAKKTFFAGLAASGWHTAAMTMRLLVDSDLRIAGGIVGAGGADLRWPRAVRAGDILHLKVEVIDRRTSQSRPALGIVKVRLTTFNQRGEVVQVSTPALMVPRRTTNV